MLRVLRANSWIAGWSGGRRFGAVAALSAAWLLTALPAAAGTGVYQPETFTLDNGMQVVVVTNRRVPVVTHMVWYRVGAGDEAFGKSGIAHFLEHLMFKGTDDVAAGDFSKIVARNGGRDNAFTSWDFTAYFQTIARDRLELVMTLEADRMADLALSDQVVATERDVVLEERRQRTDSEPADRLGEQVSATLYVNHPYGRPIIGWENEIRGLTRADAEAFYRTWYVPNNAILVVTGDVDAAELRPLAEKTYGKLAPRPLPARSRPEAAPLSAERRVILRDPEVRQPSLQLQFIAPSGTDDNREVAYALEVLVDVLGASATSRLDRQLVIDRKLASSVWASYSAASLDLSAVGVGGTPAPGVSIEVLETAINEELRKLVDTGVTAEELAAAKKRMLTEAVYARDSLSGPGYHLGMALTTGRSVEEVESWPERIAAVTVDQVNAAARQVLGQSGRVVGVLVPAQPEREVAEKGNPAQ